MSREWIAALAGSRILVRKILRQAVDHRVIEQRRNAPHRRLDILFRSRLASEVLQLLCQINRHLRGQTLRSPRQKQIGRPRCNWKPAADVRHGWDSRYAATASMSAMRRFNATPCMTATLRMLL